MSIRDLQVDQQPIEVGNLKDKMIFIHENLSTRTPELVDALVIVHKGLMEHEELVHLLDDDDIHDLHKAHEIHKQVVIVQKEDKKVRTSSRKKLSDNDLANL